MMNFYDDTNIISFDERTKVKFISFEVIKDRE